MGQIEPHATHKQPPSLFGRVACCCLCSSPDPAVHLRRISSACISSAKYNRILMLWCTKKNGPESAIDNLTKSSSHQNHKQENMFLAIAHVQIVDPQYAQKQGNLTSTRHNSNQVSSLMRSLQSALCNHPPHHYSMALKHCFCLDTLRQANTPAHHNAWSFVSGNASTERLLSNIQIQRMNDPCCPCIA